MKLLLTAAVIALAFTTGFTCSKNTPPADQQPVVTPAPTEVPAAPAEGAAPTEGQPTGETK